MEDKSKEASNINENKPGIDDLEVYRMWSAISFSVMLIVIGIPLWWKTTEVYRASLPYSEIDALDPSKVGIKTNILVYAKYPNQANDVIDALTNIFSNLSMFNVDIKPFKINNEPVTYDSIESASIIHPKKAGDILLVHVPSLPENNRIYVSNHRILYFTNHEDAASLGKILLDWFFEEEALLDKVSSILIPQKFQKSEDNTNRLRASLGYDVIFTIINSDPEKVDFFWDVKSDVIGYMKPLLNQISEVGQHHVKSQWLYLMDLGEIPRQDESGWFYFKFSQLPHIITPLEKKLGSGISKNPCIHMILYVASCHQQPLCFLSEDELRVAGMISPHWGAVQILNPSKENCDNHTRVDFSPREVMSIFISQFHGLLGVKGKEGGDGIGIAKAEGPLLRSWELDSLHRMRTVEQIVSASLTLQSLSKLLGEISNIVINEEVASSITTAVERVQKAGEELQKGNLVEALNYSRQAYSSSETAFSDPSLLSLLYFPDDQKYAVYIPLFLPIMIPVIMSLKRIFIWITKGTNKSQLENSEIKAQ